MSCRRVLYTAAILFCIVSFYGGPVVRSTEASNADSAGGSLLYVITNPDGPNAIAAYRRNPETGELSFLGTYPTGGRGTGRIVDSQSPLVANQDGTFLFAANTGSNDISVMAIGQDGSLQLVGPPVNSRGIAPSSLALRGDLLYVANKGDAATPPNYVGFRVSGSGELVRIKRRFELNIGDNPAHILFNGAGTMVIGTRLGGRVIDCFAIAVNGRLRRLSRLENQPGPFGAAFNPANNEQLLVSDARLPGATSIRVTSAGELSVVSSVSNSPERAACWITVHSNGRFAWVANTGTNSLSLYSINNDGALALVSSHSTVEFGRAPFEIALDASGQFLYQLNVAAGNQSAHVLRVTGEAADGGLTDVSTAGLPAGSAPIGLVVVGR